MILTRCVVQVPLQQYKEDWRIKKQGNGQIAISHHATSSFVLPLPPLQLLRYAMHANASLLAWLDGIPRWSKRYCVSSFMPILVFFPNWLERDFLIPKLVVSYKTSNLLEINDQTKYIMSQFQSREGKKSFTEKLEKVRQLWNSTKKDLTQSSSKSLSLKQTKPSGQVSKSFKHYKPWVVDNEKHWYCATYNIVFLWPCI